MYGVVRNRFVTTSMTKNQHGRRRRLPLNPNKRKITTGSDTCPASQGEAGSGWIEKLRRSRIFASVVGSVVGSTATFQYMSIATAKAQEKPVKKLTCFEEEKKKKVVAFPFDGKDLIDDQSIRKLYERWLTQYGVTRHPDEKEEHYEAFKSKAYNIYFVNTLHKEDRLAMNHFGDTTDQEWEDMHPPIQLISGTSDPLFIALLESMQQDADAAGRGRLKKN